MTTYRDQMTGLLLAGGRARRMDGLDKGLIDLGGRPMAEWVLERLVPQTGSVLISANRNIKRYAKLGFEVVSDESGDFMGPLAGIAAGLSRMKTAWLATAPCDSPFIADDLVDRLCTGAIGTDTHIAVAHDGNRLQPVFSVIHSQLLPDLENFLQSGGRKIDLWLDRHPWQSVDFSDQPDMFLNVNTAEELSKLEKRLSS